MKRILIIDQDEEAAGSMATFLQSEGHDTRVAYAGDAGLHLASHFRPAIVFLALDMPWEDSIRLAQRLRQLPTLDNLAIAAMSATRDEATQQQVRKSSFNFYIVKPAEPGALLDMMRYLSFNELTWFGHALY